jgi:hypothetical protein
MLIDFFEGPQSTRHSIIEKTIILKLPLHGLLNFDTVGFYEIIMDFIFSWTIECVLNLCHTSKSPIEKNKLKGLNFVYEHRWFEL